MVKSNSDNWVRREGCSCNRCREAENNVGSNTDRNDKSKKHGNQILTEFQFDQNFFDREIFEEPISILQVEFNRVSAGDKIWFSGIVSVDNDDDEFVTLVLNIVRTRANGLSNTIYTQLFEIDEENQDDITQIPFAHVQVEANGISDVTYTVTIERQDNTGEVFLFGQSTLTAVRFS